MAVSLPSGAANTGFSGISWQTSPGDEGVYEVTMIVEQAGELVFSQKVNLIVYEPDGPMAAARAIGYLSGLVESSERRSA